LPGGLRLVAPFVHEGAARELVHLLKYRGMRFPAALAAEMLAERMPSLPLVPVPRALSRRLRYGVDPAREIALAISAHNGAPVVSALVPPLHAPRRAGREHGRAVPEFVLWRRLSGPVVVVDDVVTTGATVAAAVRAIGVERVQMVVAANSVSGVSTLTSS